MNDLRVTAATGDVRGAVPFSRLPWIRPLVHAYATDFPSVAAFFPGDPADDRAWPAAIARVQRGRRSGVDIASVLARQLARRRAPAPAVDLAALLADRKAVAVLTGQQAGLFGGPLYTLLKAVSTIRLARHIETTTGTRTVPVFWVDSEDHDWDEIRSAAILDREGAVTTVALEPVPGAGAQPVGRLALDDTIEPAIATLAAALSPTEYTPALAERLRRCYRPGTPVTTAFATFVDDLLGPEGLVVFEADDPAAKPFLVDLFRHEISHPCEAAILARRGGDRMAALGHAPQIVPSDETVSLFYLDERGRTPVRYRDGRFVVGDDERPGQDLAAEAADHPERFSPNVLLRPVVQDTLFPTVAYVAGPSELAYQAQLADVYAAHRVEPPLLVSRVSATIVDSGAVKFLDRSGLPLEALQPQDESALNRLLEEQLPPALDQTCSELDQFIASRTERLRSVAVSVDPTLSGAVDTTMERLRDTVKTLQNKIVQAAKKKDDTLRRQFTRTRALAFPDGQPQERHLNLSFFLNRYGFDLPARLLAAVPPVPDAHLIIAP